MSYHKDGLRTTFPQISFQFLFIKTCYKLHNEFGFIIQFCVGIQYLIYRHLWAVHDRFQLPLLVDC